MHMSKTDRENGKVANSLVVPVEMDMKTCMENCNRTLKTATITVLRKRKHTELQLVVSVTIWILRRWCVSAKLRRTNEIHAKIIDCATFFQNWSLYFLMRESKGGWKFYQYRSFFNYGVVWSSNAMGNRVQR